MSKENKPMEVPADDELEGFSNLQRLAIREMFWNYGKKGIMDLTELELLRFKGCGKGWLRKLVRRGLYISPHYLSKEDRAIKKKSGRIKQLRASIEKNELKIERFRRELDEIIKGMDARIRSNGPS